MQFYRCTCLLLEIKYCKILTFQGRNLQFACLCPINKSVLQSLDSEDSGCWQIFADNMRQPRLIQCLSVGVWMWLLPLLWSVIVTRAGYKLIFPLQIPVWHRHYAVTILSPPDLQSQTPALQIILPTWVQNTTQFKYQEREEGMIAVVRFVWKYWNVCFSNRQQLAGRPRPGAQIRLHPS